MEFSEFLRILGKGPKTKRGLTIEESVTAVHCILKGQVTDRQMGAFLLLMRANGETPEELIGFVKGIRQVLDLTDKANGRVQLDWSAYAGKWRYPPYFLLAIKLINQMGYTVGLHGDSGQFQNRVYADECLSALGFSEVENLGQARQQAESGQLVYLPLDNFLPEIKAILHLKEEIGVRTVFNSVVKMLNPFDATCAVQGIYHKGVEKLHHAGAFENGAVRNLVFKGEGGEAEIRADALTHLYLSNYAKTDQQFEKSWPAIIERQLRPKQWTPDDLLALWLGDKNDIYGEASVVSTTAAALRLLDLTITTQQQALDRAFQAWSDRLQ